MNKEIDLYGLEQAALIILSDRGAIYKNQAGGTACMQPKAKGIFVPITNDSPLDNPYSGSLAYKLGKVCQDIKITELMADNLDIVLQKEVYDLVIKVDRNRLNESMEAWVYVNISESSSELIGYGGSQAILIWPNSD